MATKKTTQGREFEKALKSSTESKFGKDFGSLDIYSGSYSKDELKIIRKTLAKRANQRLVRLERASSAITGESYSSYGAAEKAYDYIEKHRPGAKKLRYSEDFGFNSDNSWDIKKEITAIQAFLESKSSTVKGQKAIEKRRVETFEKKGVHFAGNKEFYDFLNSNTMSSLVASGITSDDIVEFYVRAKDSGMSHDKIMSNMSEALDAYRDKTTRVSIKDFEKRVLKGGANQ